MFRREGHRPQPPPLAHVADRAGRGAEDGSARDGVSTPARARTQPQRDTTPAPEERHRALSQLS